MFLPDYIQKSYKKVTKQNRVNASVYINDSYRDKDGKSMLYLRVRINKKYVLISMDIKVLPSNFDKKTNQVINRKDKKTINNLIKEKVGRASDIILKYQVNKKALTSESFKREYSQPSLLVDFHRFMEHEIKSRYNEITESSIKQHLAILSKMKEFRSELLISELTEDYLHKFSKHLKTKRHNKQNTIHNALKTIKTYVNIAIRKDLIKKSPFLYFNMRRDKTYPMFLTREETMLLKSIYDNDLLHIVSQKKVLRWFLFAIETGLRIGDLKRAKHENIVSKTLRIHPHKTKNVNNRRIDIPLTRYALKLIKDENPHRISGVLFDCISEQKMNSTIKAVMKFANIDKKVSFHTARHTFATLFLQSCKQANGILMLQKLLGHANITTTSIYTHVLTSDLVDAMNDFANTIV